MLVKKIFKYVLLLLALAYFILDSLQFNFESNTVRAIAFVLLFFLYYRWTIHKSKMLLWFLLTRIMGVFFFYSQYFEAIAQLNYEYYFYFTGAVLYTVSYLFLILEIVSDWNFKPIFKTFWIPILILLVLNVCCVILIVETSIEGDDSYNLYDIIQTYLYHTFIMISLSAALINYMHRGDMKSMLLLIGCISLFFSDMLWLAHYFAIEKIIINSISRFTYVLGFTFMYLQSQVQYTSLKPDKSEF